MTAPSLLKTAPRIEKVGLCEFNDATYILQNSHGHHRVSCACTEDASAPQCAYRPMYAKNKWDLFCISLGLHYLCSYATPYLQLLHDDE